MKKHLLIFFAIFLMISLVGCNSENKAESKSNSKNTEEASADVEVADEAESDIDVDDISNELLELTPKEEMTQELMSLIDEGKAFDSGSYIEGDIPKGEYAFITFDGSGQYYSEEDSSGNIVDNENFDGFGYVSVQEVGNLTNSGALVKVEALDELGVAGAKELYEIMNEKEDYKESGWYKIGKDLDPGKYVIESVGSSYVGVYSGPVGNNEIINNENFNGRYSVNVQEGQYLQISGGEIAE